MPMPEVMDAPRVAQIIREKDNMTVVMEKNVAAGIEELRSQLRGYVLIDSDAGYDERRAVFNGRVDRRPQIIIVPSGTGDVAAAMRFARANDLAIGVKSGGHGSAGWAVPSGGLMIDFSAWKSAEVDPVAKTVRAQPGLTTGELNRATIEHGLTVPTGKISTVGVGGLTLGGGIGWLARKYGLAIDHLRSVEIVTGDGEIRTASAQENPDLFWGVRGAGSTFGVVTSFEFDLVPVDTVLAGFVAYPLELAPQVVQAYRTLTANAPDELTSILALVTMPDAPAMVAPVVTWSGELAEGERVLAPLRTIGTPMVDMIAPMPYGALQAKLSEMAPGGVSREEKTAYVNGCTDELFLTMVERYRVAPNPLLSIMFIEHYGGAVSRVADDAMAFANRDKEFNLLFGAGWVDPADEAASLEWLQGTWDAVRPYTTPAAYLNYFDVSDSHRAEEAFGADKFRRILDLKAIYDPRGLFRSNPVTPVLP
jgi:hypothetical protein